MTLTAPALLATGRGLDPAHPGPRSDAAVVPPVSADHLDLLVVPGPAGARPVDLTDRQARQLRSKGSRQACGAIIW